jgi:hypothetical protein
LGRQLCVFTATNTMEVERGIRFVSGLELERFSSAAILIAMASATGSFAAPCYAVPTV